MISKLVVLAAVVAVVASQAAQYPAGVSPHLCPNYPHCDNALLGAHAQAAAGNPGALHSGQYVPQQHNDGQYVPQQHNEGQYVPQQHNEGQYVPQHHNPYAAPAVPSYVPNHLGGHPGQPAAAQYPAGVSPAQCPNYPYCSGHIGGPGPVAAPPLPGFSSRQYPDGVSPHNCPNYPYCH